MYKIFQRIIVIGSFALLSACGGGGGGGGGGRGGGGGGRRWALGRARGVAGGFMTTEALRVATQRRD